jgi:DNA-binding MarR family transcriptional regulator
MVSVVDDLEKMRLARREVRPDDRRVRSIVITQKGRRVLERAERMAEKVDVSFFGALSLSERRVLTGMLTRLLDSAGLPAGTGAAAAGREGGKARRGTV